MTTQEKINTAVASLDPSTTLYDLPDIEFDSATGAITLACSAAGYDEFGRALVNASNSWSMTVKEFVESLVDENTR